MLAVELEPMFAEEAKKRQQEAGEKYGRGLGGKLPPNLAEAIEPETKESRVQAGQLFGIGHSTVSKAKKISKVKPSKVKDIIAGKTTIDAVYRKSFGCTYVDAKHLLPMSVLNFNNGKIAKIKQQAKEVITNVRARET